MILSSENPIQSTLTGLPPGYDAKWVSSQCTQGNTVLMVVRDDARMHQLREAIGFFAPKTNVLLFPAWDCVPYDRVSPEKETIAQRLRTLSALCHSSSPFVLITTCNALLQRVMPKTSLTAQTLSLKSGDSIEQQHLLNFFTHAGFRRVETVYEPGEYSVRGGLIDVYSSGHPQPVRLDFFGDTLESLRAFDPQTQRTTDAINNLQFGIMNEVVLTEDSITRFRTKYRETFGVSGDQDALYESISAGQPYPGMEHWQSLFYESTDTLLDYISPDLTLFEDQILGQVDARFAQIQDHYEARQQALAISRTSLEDRYRPLPPNMMYLDDAQLQGIIKSCQAQTISAFSNPEISQDMGGKLLPDYTDVRTKDAGKLIDRVLQTCHAAFHEKKNVLITCYAPSSLERLKHMFEQHDFHALHEVDTWDAALKKAHSTKGQFIFMTQLGIERGFNAPDFIVITEQDIFGERLTRRAKPKKSATQLLADLGQWEQDEYVVHTSHGIGQFKGLLNLDINGAPHDCALVVYAGGDKLFVPVENLDVLTRYGSADGIAPLDKLGGSGWNARKARVKAKIKDIAEKLMKTAAQRETQTMPSIVPPEGLYDEFAARFPYVETDDQLQAIGEVANDLSLGRPMDRLICGDVGFGKTEVALRGAFLAAASGKQVAIVTPTTLLCRQHTKSFKERFAGLPFKVVQLSRLVSPKDAATTRDELANGQADIVIATHALFSDKTKFKNLGLVIVDEEQHFGVSQKEKLKALKEGVHVLTLSATPIPRTLQMALSGVRELSMIATPPVDRLAVRTFVLPYDGMIIREALMREKYRNGQTFYVCPRLKDMEALAERLRKLVPELKIATAHGQLTPKQLDDVMNAFCDGAYDVLLSTNIVESGIDIPTANTIIIHRADMFGLAQLYQLRGRVGRAKERGYAYLTLSASKMLSPTAQKRLEVMQTLDGLGAGFSLASHDMDIRGAGNLVGEEQSGHVKEVGVALYQHMLEEAVQSLKSQQDDGDEVQETFSPQINLGLSVMIPESYVSDLNLRLSLYRRLSSMTELDDIRAIEDEMVDRFGPLPEEVRNLTTVLTLKHHCRTAHIERIDAGQKGCVLTFHDNKFPNPLELVKYMQSQKGVKLRPDHKFVIARAWINQTERIKGIKRIVQDLVSMVG